MLPFPKEGEAYGETPQLYNPKSVSKKSIELLQPQHQSPVSVACAYKEGIPSSEQ